MTPLKSKIIVKAYLEQKESHQIKCDDGKVINLYIGRKYAENNREANPTVCEVISVPDNITEVSVGDTLVVHHNLIGNQASHIETDTEEQSVLLTICADFTVYAKILQNGTLQPVFGNLIAERISKPSPFVSSVLVSPFEETKEYEFKVLAVSEGEEDVKVGDTILCYKHSDYEMVYHFNNKEHRAIRIVKNDVLGIIQSVEYEA